MPLPEDEESSGELDVMFATNRGTTRRNKLSDFVQVNRNGKIAMKLDEGDAIVGVETCTDSDDVLLTTAKGQAIRFKVTDVRVFAGRNSVGVRGISLADGDEVISMTVLRGFEATADERAAYIKMRRAMEGEELEAADGEDEGTADAGISQERYIEMGAAEQFILTLSENGFGKRSSAYEYRVTGRGGKGITAMTVNDRNGDLVASFPVEETDQIMLVTDGGQLIRCPVNDIRIAGRSTQGVTVFRTAEDETVVSVSRISEDVNGDADDEGSAEEAAPEA
jgi:DNA gyrase subunit A